MEKKDRENIGLGLMIVWGIASGWYGYFLHYNETQKPLTYEVYKIGFTFSKCKCTVIKNVNGYQQLGDSIKTWTINKVRDTAYVTHENYSFRDMTQYSVQRF